MRQTRTTVDQILELDLRISNMKVFFSSQHCYQPTLPYPTKPYTILNTPDPTLFHSTIYHTTFILLSKYNSYPSFETAHWTYVRPRENVMTVGPWGFYRFTQSDDITLIYYNSMLTVQSKQEISKFQARTGIAESLSYRVLGSQS